MEQDVDELNRKCPFTFSISDDKNEVAYVELTQINSIFYIDNSYTSPAFQKYFFVTRCDGSFKKDVFLGYFCHLYTMVKLFPCKIEDMDLPKRLNVKS